jgi:hypothetical protein
MQKRKSVLPEMAAAASIFKPRCEQIAVDCSYKGAPISAERLNFAALLFDELF